MPEEGYWAPQWRETEDEIVLDWIETEAPEPEEYTPLPVYPIVAPEIEDINLINAE